MYLKILVPVMLGINDASKLPTGRGKTTSRQPSVWEPPPHVILQIAMTNYKQPPSLTLRYKPSWVLFTHIYFLELNLPSASLTSTKLSIYIITMHNSICHKNFDSASISMHLLMIDPPMPLFTLDISLLWKVSLRQQQCIWQYG